jgi:N,N'-diacetylchitobiose transport system substrate-binding protein
MKKGLIALTAIALTVMGLGGGGIAASAQSNHTQSSHTLTVWLMTGEISTPVSNAVTAAFQKEYPGWTVNIEIQQWNGIATKLITALASTSPPDAMEIGNTDVAEFAASGGLENLSSVKSSLPNSSNYLQGLEGPAEYNGGLYAVPLLAGDRVVIYNKQMFKQAGITEPPNSLDELLNDGSALKASFSKVKDFSPLYLPGEYWYAGLPLIWAYGGQIAIKTGGKWVGDLTSPGSLAGLKEWETIQNFLSVPASRDVNTNAPDQDTVLADGQAAMIVGGGWELGAITSTNKKLTGQLGTFVFPGPNVGTPSPVFIGGSDIGIANASPNKAEALAWVKLMTDAKYQIQMVKDDGLMPNATSLLSVGKSLPNQADFYKAANLSDFTPPSPGWATVENDAVMETLFSQVAEGTQNVALIAKSTDSRLDTLLNAQQ